MTALESTEVRVKSGAWIRTRMCTLLQPWTNWAVFPAPGVGAVDAGALSSPGGLGWEIGDHSNLGSRVRAATARAGPGSAHAGSRCWRWSGQSARIGVAGKVRCN